MLYRIEGIVIRSTDYGEGNKILTLLTDKAGKVGIIARGAKKARSRHSSIAQPFTYGEFVFFRSSGLGTLNAGEIIESFHRLREDLDLAAYASYAAELCDRALQDDEAGEFIFQQLKACFMGLAEGKDPEVTVNLFEMKILETAGYAPELDVCVSCGNEEGPVRISVQAGGTLCRRCWSRDASALPVSDGALKLLRLFRRLDMRRLGSIQVSVETKKQLKAVLRSFFDTHMDLRLKSRAFLDQLDRMNQQADAPLRERRSLYDDGK
ncbi:DNA repair protein RecO [Paenibacillus beijingensis]|uniref:DNA repair protein RecO n=1 Tax=Paenibacillus beijingensis TaxID=1126833 RepID=A0A0D5NMF0_9BACL|nr:DNA repair protein RecO [Paenibacillus beijingensis]AJY76330.1 DNA recombination protein RecO [Paenibacillus beijingensis]